MNLYYKAIRNNHQSWNKVKLPWYYEGVLQKMYYTLLWTIVILFPFQVISDPWTPTHIRILRVITLNVKLNTTNQRHIKTNNQPSVLAQMLMMPQSTIDLVNEVAEDMQRIFPYLPLKSHIRRFNTNPSYFRHQKLMIEIHDGILRNNL